MIHIFVSLLLLLQGIPVQQGGTVTGVLRDSAGRPLEGIRITAVARPDAREDVTDGTAMAALAQTDAEGKFTLENVPPGRYYIAAGRLDLQTYYPGTQIPNDATVVTIAAGATVSGINFALNNTSFGRASGSGVLTGSIVAPIPVRVTVENGGKLPIFANGKLVVLRLESNVANPLMIPIDGVEFFVPGPVAGDFRVIVDGLPDTYVVKSMSYGATDITRGTFRLTSANFSISSMTLTPVPQPVPVPLSGNEAALRAYLEGLAAGRQSYSIVPVTRSPATPPSGVSITLALNAPRSTSGARVSGRLGSKTKRSVYISGRPGVVFSDGTFEFRDVPPGRHLIAALDNSSVAMATMVVVGDKDIGNVELKETLLLPADARTPREPPPVGEYAPGSIVPLGRISGLVLEEATKTPITEGNVLVTAGNYSRQIPIDSNGRFETFQLLPGTYDLKLQVFGHSTSGPTVVVDDKDLTLELTTRRLY